VSVEDIKFSRRAGSNRALRVKGIKLPGRTCRSKASRVEGFKFFGRTGRNKASRVEGFKFSGLTCRDKALRVEGFKFPGRTGRNKASRVAGFKFSGLAGRNRASRVEDFKFFGRNGRIRQWTRGLLSSSLGSAEVARCSGSVKGRLSAQQVVEVRGAAVVRQRKGFIKQVKVATQHLAPPRRKRARRRTQRHITSGIITRIERGGQPEVKRVETPEQQVGQSLAQHLVKPGR